MDRFVLFGCDHLVALLLTIVISVLLVVLLRARERAQKPVRVALAVMLLCATTVYLVAEAMTRPLAVWDFLPLHLCDMAIFVAAAALITKNRILVELIYFWGCSGTLLATITPDVWFSFPDPQFIAYFVLHGGVVISAVTLVFGCRRYPSKGAPWRALLLTNLYAALVGAVNASFQTNFLYLCQKPVSVTLLDWFGPWPVYLLVGEGVALGLFALLFLPFHLRSR